MDSNEMDGFGMSGQSKAAEAWVSPLSYTGSDVSVPVRPPDPTEFEVHFRNLPA